jgi:hypothetical protein
VAIDGTLLENHGIGFAGMLCLQGASAIPAAYNASADSSQGIKINTKTQRATVILTLSFISYAFREVTFSRRFTNDHGDRRSFFPPK